MPRGPIKGLTRRQAETLEWIKAYIREHELPPSIVEIADAFGVRAPSAHDVLMALEQKGYLERRPGRGPRSLVVARRAGAGRERRRQVPLAGDGTIRVPVIGRVAAGEPILAEENIVGRVRVDALLARGQCFALEVKGDSMVDAGIPDGGLVIVRQQSVAENGDVVVAILGGDEATVKRLSIEDDRIELRPENERYAPIRVGPNDELRILGKVVGVRERKAG